MALSIAYHAGLRAAEVAALKVADIDSERMLLRSSAARPGGIATRQGRCPMVFFSAVALAATVISRLRSTPADLGHRAINPIPTKPYFSKNLSNA